MAFRLSGTNIHPGNQANFRPFATVTNSSYQPHLLDRSIWLLPNTRTSKPRSQLLLNVNILVELELHPSHTGRLSTTRFSLPFYSAPICSESPEAIVITESFKSHCMRRLGALITVQTGYPEVKLLHKT